jgi:hypothetical protein
MNDKPRGPFCTVPGCIEPAEGAVLLAHAREWRRYLCSEHLRPVRAELVKLLHEPVPAP